MYGGKVYHGKDAFEGLRIMDHLAQSKLDDLDREIEDRLAKRAQTDEKLAAMKEKDSRRRGDPARRRAGALAQPLTVTWTCPTAPFGGSRLVESVSLSTRCIRLSIRSRSTVANGNSKKER